MRGLLPPFRNTTGVARWILLIGLVLTVVFVVLAVFAPWIAPFDFNQRRASGAKFAKLASPERALARRQRPVLRHVSR